MIVMLLSLIIIAASILAFRKFAVRHPYSKGLLLAILVAIAAVICLAHNDTQSRIHETNDGIGISNPIAYWIIGDNGWSQEKFRHAFERSIYFTLLAIIAYPAVLAAESKVKLGKKS